MIHYGILCPAVPGHLHPMSALGRELQQRGHKVSFLSIADAATKIQSEGMEHIVIGHSDWPEGSYREAVAQLGLLTGLPALRYTVRLFTKMVTTVCRDMPEAVMRAGIQALLVDQTTPCGAAVAEKLGLPYVTICCAVAMNRELDVPPCMAPWSYEVNSWARLRNRLGYGALDKILAPGRKTLNRYRRQWGLAERCNFDDTASPLAQITQQPAAFDFPRRNLPPHFHYAGPFRRSAEFVPEPVPFPFEQLDGRPILYASLGTLQNRTRSVFKAISAACEGLDMQLVLSLGGGGQAEDLGPLPGAPIVVAYAPQLALLAKACMVITHAGLNTTLEALSQGVPLLAIPITNDQPGVAARLRWTGTGEVLPLAQLNPIRLRAAIQRVRNDPDYTRAARRMQEAILNSGGVKIAADIVELAVATRKPVLRNWTETARAYPGRAAHRE